MSSRIARVVTAAAVAILAMLALPATPSSATTYYEYWSYWHKAPGASSWQYSSVGPSGYYLKQGTQVEGWRFAVGTASPSDPQPRPTDVTYDDYCNGKNAGAKYRVLLVVDYGTQSGAPKGPVYSCYGSDTQPSGRDVLDATHPDRVRDSGGLICAIDYYPKSGCGDVVSSPAPKASRTPTTTATPPHRAVAPVPSRAGSSTPTPSAAATRRRNTPAPAATPTATTSASGSVTPSPPDSSPVVATPFVAPRRHGGVPYGFVAACVFVVAVIGAVLWQRRRRAG